MGCDHDRMGSAWFSTVVDCRDPGLLAEFWCDALGYVVVFRDDTTVAIARDDESHPGLQFVRVSGPKTAKNRVHIDLKPDDQAAEVERLLASGATHVDIGHGDVSWVVLADPEGNEFCVLADW